MRGLSNLARPTAPHAPLRIGAVRRPRMARMRRLRGLLANLALSAASLLVVAGAIEVWARLVVWRWSRLPNPVRSPFVQHDPLLGWSKPPGAEGWLIRPEYRVHLRINAHGLRGPDRPYQKPPGVRRLLLLGDSFTEGAGVPRAADRFGDLVESWLNEELAASGSPLRVHAFNAGKGASSPVHWVEYQRFFAAWYRPDAVVAVFFLRDGAPLSTSLKLNRAIIEPIRRRWRARPLYEESALLRFFYERFAWREYDREFRRRLTAAYLGSGPERDYGELQQAALREIAADCRARGIRFHLVIFPMLLELDDYPFFEVERAIETFAAEAGIPSFSLTPGFEGLEDRTLWVAPNDQHPNEEGHRVAAATLLPYLGREVLGLPSVAGR